MHFKQKEFLITYFFITFFQTLKREKRRPEVSVLHSVNGKIPLSNHFSAIFKIFFTTSSISLDFIDLFLQTIFLLNFTD